MPEVDVEDFCMNCGYDDHYEENCLGGRNAQSVKVDSYIGDTSKKEGTRNTNEVYTFAPMMIKT
ncbi:hypothetical protein Sjap_014877 [Stephania japonica]|uniref:Uncharacterized protein n=1 Tax=Stephania japonica TaxID=461633 RepID=A0AAP0NSB9_9MAGN